MEGQVKGGFESEEGRREFQGSRGNQDEGFLFGPDQAEKGSRKFPFNPSTEEIVNCQDLTPMS